MKFWKYIFGILLLILSGLLIAIFQIPDRNLHIIACNVGTGDAILITYGTTQILTDGGPDKSVMTCLGKYMPFWDRNIELVISTHPDADHSTGLTDVIKNYNVDEILINPIDPGTQIYEVLKKEVGGRGIPVINPVEGMRVRLGLIYLDIENPSEELLNKLTVKNEGDGLAKYDISSDTNLYSVVYKLSFKNFSGLFLGDAPPEVNDRLSTGSAVEGVNYIKIPHHGSNNGLTQDLLEKIVGSLPPPNSQHEPYTNSIEKASAKVVGVISVGKNSWGFPKTEILDMLGKYGVQILRTDKMGDVRVVTNGDKFWIED